MVAVPQVVFTYRRSPESAFREAYHPAHEDVLQVFLKQVLLNGIGIAVSLILGVSFYEIFNNVQINP